MRLEKVRAKGGEYLYRDTVTGIFYFRRYKKSTGDQKRSLKTKNLTEAKALRDEIVKSGPRKSVLWRQTALELFDEWALRKATMGASKGTLTSIHASREHFACFFKSMFLDEITARWWESTYVPTIREKSGNPKRKFFNDRKWLNAFLLQAKEDGLLSVTPKLGKVDPVTEAGKVFTDEEIEGLLNFAQNEDLYLAIAMAATMGMRRGEIFALRCESVNPIDKTITLKPEETKTRRGRSFAVSDMCWPLIEARLNSGSPWVFPSKHDLSKPLHKDGYMTAWRNLKKMTGISGRFHDLRHTFLTKAFKNKNANPALICYYAGLSLEVAEKVYLHFTADDTKGMRDIVEY